MPTSNPIFKKKMKKKFGKDPYLSVEEQKLVTSSKDASTVTRHIIRKRPADGVAKDGLSIPDATLIKDMNRNKPQTVLEGIPIQKDGTILQRAPANVSPPPGSVPYYERANSIVQPNQSLVILTIIPSPSKLLYLRSIGHSFFDGQEEFFLVYDGTVWKRWNYQIGTPVNLYQFQGSLSATKSIQFGVTNLSPNARNYEMAGDGWEVIIRMLHESENE